MLGGRPLQRPPVTSARAAVAPGTQQIDNDVVSRSYRGPGLCDTGQVKLNLTADEVLTTTRSVRKRLDFERPVEHAVVREALEIALQAPTASNGQAWHWVVVEDRDSKKAIAEIYRATADRHLATLDPTYDDGDVRGERMTAVLDSARYLAANLERVPLYVIPCQSGRIESRGGTPAGFFGSIIPAAWSLMLALRERGLGSAWTTLHLAGDGERRTAEILGIPYESITQVALLPIAYTIGTDFKPAKRQPLDTVLHWDTW